MATINVDVNKVKLLPITGELKDDLPAIIEYNQTVLDHYESDWTAAGLDADRRRLNLIHALRVHLEGQAARRRQAIEASLGANFTVNDFHAAIQTAFFNDEYKAHFQAIYTNRRLYDDTISPLSAYATPTYHILRKAGYTTFDEFNRLIMAKIPQESPSRQRWRNHMNQHAGDITHALFTLEAEDQAAQRSSDWTIQTRIPRKNKGRAGDLDQLDPRKPKRPARYYTGGGACRKHAFDTNSKGEALSSHLWKECNDNKNKQQTTDKTRGSENKSISSTAERACMCGSTAHKFRDCPHKQQILQHARDIGKGKGKATLNLVEETVNTTTESSAHPPLEKADDAPSTSNGAHSQQPPPSSHMEVDSASDFFTAPLSPPLPFSPHVDSDEELTLADLLKRG